MDDRFKSEDVSAAPIRVVRLIYNAGVSVLKTKISMCIYVQSSDNGIDEFSPICCITECWLYMFTAGC